MPKIMLNSVEYTGGGGDSGMELTYDEYLALPEEEKNNGTTYYIKDINGVGKDEFQPVIYSEDEREIGVWTDGKPLYQRTIVVSSAKSMSSGSWTTIFTDNFIGTIAQLITVEFINPVNNGAYNAYNYKIVDNNLQIIVNWSGGFTLSAGSTFALRYTKTTDQPGSGTWTPQGVPAVHYDGNEKVVGTWIDGGTLYERTYSIASVPQSTSYSFENDASDIIPHSFNGVYTDDATRQIPNSVSSNPIVVYKYNNKLTIQNSSNHILTNVEITVRYTKTTS